MVSNNTLLKSNGKPFCKLPETKPNLKQTKKKDQI